MLKLVAMNSLEVDPQSNAAFVSCYEGGDADDEREPFGDLPQQSALGVSAAPYPPDANGRAEAVVAVGVGGGNGRVIGAWDVRAAPVTGNLLPGDSALHCTGPDQPAQFLCKQDGRSSSMLAKDTSGQLHSVILSGEDKTLTISVGGYAVSVGKEGISMTSANGQNGISITNDSVHLKGAVVLGGMLPIPAQQLATSTAIGWAALSGPAGQPVIPVDGVFVGV